MHGRVLGRREANSSSRCCALRRLQPQELQKAADVQVAVPPFIMISMKTQESIVNVMGGAKCNDRAKG